MNNDFLNDELSEKELEKIKNFLSNMSNNDFIDEIGKTHKSNIFSNVQIKNIYDKEFTRDFITGRCISIKETYLMY